MDEFELIEAVSKDWPRSGEGLIQGVDDDAAVIEGPRDNRWLVTTDILAEGIHFERVWMDWDALGEKALLVNISDIAAMGGVPWFYFVSLGCPADVGREELAQFYDGMRLVADEYDMILAGGDTSSSLSGFFASITVLGSADKDEVIYRKGAKAGDSIYVSGYLGGSAAGLLCLKKRLTNGKYEGIIAKHLLPQPRLKLARYLSEHRCANAMIDISDGLVQDLGHIILESRVGFRLHADRVPAEDGTRELATALGIDPLEMILCGGEDYELLFTMDSRQEERFFSEAARIDFGCAVTKVGEIVADAGSKLVLDAGGRDIKLSSKGYSHKIGK